MLRRAYLNAMKGLEAGLTVRDITVYDLSDCAPDERIGAVRGRVDRYDFDNVPVRDGGIVGVVENIKTYDPRRTRARRDDSACRAHADCR